MCASMFHVYCYIDVLSYIVYRIFIYYDMCNTYYIMYNKYNTLCIYIIYCVQCVIYRLMVIITNERMIDTALNKWIE